MLKDILAVSGKPGLYRLVSKGSNLLVIESLADKKRQPAYARDKVISLGDITIYTDDGETSIRDVFESIKKKEDGKAPSIDITKAQPNELREYFSEILPNFDRERVYPTDIKKMLKWYDLLLSVGITNYQEEEENPEKNDDKEEQKAENKAAASKPKTATRKKATPKTIGSANSKAAAPKAATPKKTGGKRGS